MNITYDPDADAAYISIADNIVEEHVHHTVEVPFSPNDENSYVNVDFSQNGNVLGIEILDASSHLDPHVIASAQPIHN
ncbi:DUF2283 domain-containing protein [Bifidobacterium callitrichos]|uniref:DUF2283 domain-containing protein n=1 Tax=Bifidobacterium callitrichos DSM 23973 TaxID=1437609 RepID=A0A086ZXX9_9BIFI|nr:DUF2283 domain-containing protein [Bifidobacterium callitrichos]KFI51379.1 hypothetical protein BCAL_1110 [Bifidobacterium callitrichos DSM 23973]